MNIQNALHPPDATAHLLADDGAIPNNPTLPLLVYQGALTLPDHDPAATIEALFAANGWGSSWRNGIYSYHHYHSTAHEVLACYAGSVTVKMGGESGITLSLQKGDVMVIPAGVGHKNLESSPDFGVVGAYPPGQRWDLLTGQPDERPGADQNIARVPLPPTDPLYGTTGPLVDEWLDTKTTN